jgi:hypothetical protein
MSFKEEEKKTISEMTPSELVLAIQTLCENRYCVLCDLKRYLKNIKISADSAKTIEQFREWYDSVYDAIFEEINDVM